MNTTTQFSRDDQLELLAKIPGLNLRDLSGCSADEVAEVLKAQQVADLPKSYQTFLEIAGKSTGAFLRGTDMCHPLLLRFKQDATKLVTQSSPGLTLPHDSFVFAFHQGYSLVFFRRTTEGGENVFCYTEGDHKFTDLNKSFSQWLRDTALEH